MTDNRFDLDYEFDVVSRALKSAEFLKRAQRVVDAHTLANDELQWIWTHLKQAWKNFQEVPGPSFLADESAKIKDDDQREATQRLLLKLYKRKVKDPNVVLSKLSEFVRQIEYHKAAVDLIKNVQKGDLDGAEKSIHRAAKIRIEERTYSSIQWFEEFHARQEARKFEKHHQWKIRTVPTGFKTVDRVMSGGLRKGEFGFVMGTTGRGKSITLTNFGLTAMKHGFKVVYFSFEMPALQVAQRMDSCWTGFAHEKFKTYEFRPSEFKKIRGLYRSRTKSFSGMSRILSWPVRRANVNSVLSALEDMKMEDGFVPDLLIFDSADHLDAIQMKGKGIEFRHQQAEVYWDLKSIADKEGYAIWTSTQASKAWASQIATAEAASESYDKSRIVDAILTLNDPSEIGRKRKRVEVQEEEDSEDEEEGEIKGYGNQSGKPKTLTGMLAKYRDGESRMTFKLRADFARMKLEEERNEEDEEDDGEEAGRAA